MKATSSIGRYGLAMAICAAGTALAWLSGETAWLLAAIAAACIYGGRGPGLLSIAICGLALGIFLFIPASRFLDAPDASLRLAAFLAAALVVGLLIRDYRRMEATRRAERETRLIVESMPGLGWSTDANGRFSYLNSGVFTYTGLRCEDPARVGNPADFGWMDVHHPDELDRVKKTWLEALKTGQPYESEHRIRRHDGVYRWFRAAARPQRDHSGRVTGWYGVTLDIDDQKKAEEAHRAEREARRIVESMPGLGWSTDADGNFKYLNPGVLEYTGRRGEGLDRIAGEERFGWMEVLHPEDVDRVVETWLHCLKTGQPYEIEHRVRRHDGVYRWFRAVARPQRDPAGRVTDWYGMTLDIDDQKKAEAALRKSEGNLRSIIESIPGMIATADAQGAHDYANQRLLDFVGRQPGEAARLGWTETVHPNEHAAVAAEWQRCTKAGEPMDVVHRIRRFDGEYRWFHARVEPVRDETGGIARWYGLLVDVDDQKKAEEALRKSEQQLRLLIDTIPALVWCATPSGDPFYLNKRLLDYVGLSGEEAAQSRWKIIHPDDLPTLVRTWARSVETGKSFIITYRLRRADGIYRWHEGRAERWCDQAGAVVQWYGVNVDIEDRMRAEQALRSTQASFQRASQLASLAELSASIAHEVNQPLAAVVTNSHACQRWLAAEPPNIQRARLTTERIIRDANAAAEVVSRIRALFKQSALSRTAVDINQVIAEVCLLMVDEVAARDIRIETALERDLPAASIDRVQMQQVLVNLIRNGIDAMASAGEGPRALVIRSRRDGPDRVLVEVCDYGSGVEDTERIFEPFFTTKDDGMGMGLAICRSIVEAHDGRLWAAKGDPRGTALTFTLPLRPGDTA